MGTISRKILAVGTAFLLFCGLAACGGGGGTPTPTEPTAIYGGAATAGDIFVIKMDYPATGKATITRSATDGTLIGSKEMTYTASGTQYTFTDSESHSFPAFMVKDTMLVTFLPATDEKDIIIAVIVDPTIKTVADLSFVKNHDYIITQFRHDSLGVKWVRSNVAADGSITGHHANDVPDHLAMDLDDVSETNDFREGMNVDNVVYNADTNGFTLTVGDEIWTYYITKSGLAVTDRGPDKGIRFDGLKPETSAPTGVAVGDIYDTLFYGRMSETQEGTTQGTITVTAVDGNSFTVDVDNGRDPVKTGVQITADPSPLWQGFFRVDTDNAVVQLVGSVALIFAGKSPVPNSWQYEYGIGVKRQ